MQYIHMVWLNTDLVHYVLYNETAIFREDVCTQLTACRGRILFFYIGVRLWAGDKFQNQVLVVQAILTDGADFPANLKPNQIVVSSYGKQSKKAAATPWAAFLVTVAQSCAQGTTAFWFHQFIKLTVCVHMCIETLLWYAFPSWLTVNHRLHNVKAHQVQYIH